MINIGGTKSAPVLGNGLELRFASPIICWEIAGVCGNNGTGKKINELVSISVQEKNRGTEKLSKAIEEEIEEDEVNPPIKREKKKGQFQIGKNSTSSGLSSEIKGIRFDPVVLEPDYLNLISHGHHDHLPKRLNMPAVSSSITWEVGRLRAGALKKEFLPILVKESTPIKLCGKSSSDGKEVEISIRAYDSGHTLGSTMFLIEDSSNMIVDGRVLFAGEVNFRKRHYTEGAKPVKCETLITEVIYPGIDFRLPDERKELSSLIEWLEINMKSGKIPAVHIYPFGKAQFIQLVFSDADMPFIISSQIEQINEAVCRAIEIYPEASFVNSRDFLKKTLKNNCKTHDIMEDIPDRNIPVNSPIPYRQSDIGINPHIYIASAFDHKDVLGKLGPAAVLTGHAAVKGYIHKIWHSRMVKGFAISDHCDNNSLAQFVERCSPQKLFTINKSGDNLAKRVSTQTEHLNLKKGQYTLEGW
ncbi:MAG: hypothetical protein QW728_01005 [Thermoplasmata archaeon]